jgi:hypothetical protein
MPTAVRTPQRLHELAHRASNGIEVTLLWDQRADMVSVLAKDQRSGELLELAPERHEALQAFYHPYSYGA